MRTTKKRKGTVSDRRIPYSAAEKMLMEALMAEPKDIKVPISLRLDSDVYLELKRLSEQGHGKGKYQALLIQILRHQLFGEALPSLGKRRSG